MTIDEFRNMPCFSDIQITEEQLACCRFLERKGQRFLIDFGYENASQKTWDIIDPEGTTVTGNSMDFDYDPDSLAEYRRILFGEEPSSYGKDH